MLRKRLCLLKLLLQKEKALEELIPRVFVIGLLIDFSPAFGNYLGKRQTSSLFKAILPIGYLHSFYRTYFPFNNLKVIRHHAAQHFANLIGCVQAKMTLRQPLRDCVLPKTHDIVLLKI